MHPKVIGRMVDIRATPDEVVVTCGSEVVGRHLRSWAKHRTITDPATTRPATSCGPRACMCQRPRTMTRSRCVTSPVYDRATGVA